MKIERMEPDVFFVSMGGSLNFVKKSIRGQRRFLREIAREVCFGKSAQKTCEARQQHVS